MLGSIMRVLLLVRMIIVGSLRSAERTHNKI